LLAQALLVPAFSGDDNFPWEDRYGDSENLVSLLQSDYADLQVSYRELGWARSSVHGERIDSQEDFLATGDVGAFISNNKGLFDLKTTVFAALFRIRWLDSILSRLESSAELTNDNAEMQNKISRLKEDLKICLRKEILGMLLNSDLFLREAKKISKKNKIPNIARVPFLQAVLRVLLVEREEALNQHLDSVLKEQQPIQVHPFAESFELSSAETHDKEFILGSSAAVLVSNLLIIPQTDALLKLKWWVFNLIGAVSIERGSKLMARVKYKQEWTAWKRFWDHVNADLAAEQSLESFCENNFRSDPK